MTTIAILSHGTNEAHLCRVCHPFISTLRDAHTDGIVQQLIQGHLGSAAVIVVAHRLEDVLSCNRVVVMDAGLVAEEGDPSQLLNDDSSMLSRLVRELGPNLEYKLRKEHTSSR